MKVLQIANDFCYTRVHRNLFMALDELGVEQTIFNPVRYEKNIGANYFESKNTNIIYAYVVKPFHRFVYHIKRRHVFKELLKRVDCKQFDICHASTLLTDGGIAYLLYKKYNIPYVVAVRSTDIAFLNRAPNTWFAAIKILLSAKKIFFISEALRQNLENSLVIKWILPQIKDKFVLMPNGIEDVYLDNISSETNLSHNIVYVGTFCDRKNVSRLSEAVLELKKENGLDDLKFTLVGGGKASGDEIENIIAQNADTIQYLGKISDKQKLINVFRQNSIFAMPSIHETFGLVYIEALSQGLACLYTKSQGIDGMFDDSIGIAVNPLSVEDIKNALREMLNNRSNYSNSNVDFSWFRWSNIAEKYYCYYKQILE